MALRTVTILFALIGLFACQGDEGLSSAENGIGSGSCSTLPTFIHVTKEELDDQGAVVRICEGDITVAKCEGTCSSQLKPSVGSPTGFHKHCYCCRESWMRQRTVQLTDCFTPDGTRLEEVGLSSLDIVMQEPEGCQCHKCGV